MLCFCSVIQGLIKELRCGNIKELSLARVLMFVPGSRSPQDRTGANLNKRETVDSGVDGIALGGRGSTWGKAVSQPLKHLPKYLTPLESSNR